MNYIKTFLLCVSFAFSANVMAQENPQWLRFPSISPDGKTIAFSYRGDIFLVDSEGGKARQFTTHSAYESRPIWSPDGKTIAYTSARDGAMDLFTLSIDGGTPTRLTNYTGRAIPITYTPDGKSILYNASELPDQAYGEFPSGGQVYSISIEGGRPKQFLSFEAYNISYNSSGDKYVYHDNKSYEDEWRKHHTSSVCRDVWIYDVNTDNYTNLTNKQVEDRYPVIGSDDETVYFLSERFGDFNVCQMSLNDPSEIKQLTKFTKHPVRFLTKSKTDLLCFTYDGEIYTMKAGGNAKKLQISVTMDNQEPAIIKQRMSSGANDFAISPDGKEFALIVRGDIFVSNVEFGTTKRITNTAAYEKNVSFSPDGRALVYASHKKGQWNLFMSKIKNADDKSFVYARQIEEEQLTSGGAAQFQASFSPDGKEIAFLENRTAIKVINIKSKKIRTVLPEKYNYSYADGDQGFEWSPDSKWILTKYFEKGGWQHPDIAIVKADGKGEIHNITNSGYSDINPRWALDGKAVIWNTDRQGMRSHGSWGATRDIYGVFLDKDAYAEFRMSKEELALHNELKALKKKKEEELKKKEEEKKQKEEEKKKKKDTKKSKEEDKDDKPVVDKKEDKKEEESLEFDFENLEDRILRLTIHSSNLGDAVMTKDGKKLFYFAAFEKGHDLWMHDFENRNTRLLSKTGGGGSLVLSKDGKNLYMISSGGVGIINQANGQIKRLSYSVDFELKPSEEREAVFNYVWQQVHDKFYLSDFGGVDWDFYKKAYKKYLPFISNNYDLADMLGEMLGELNASHTGARYAEGTRRASTGTLAAFFDDSYTGEGLKIKEMINKGPLQLSGDIKNGMIIKQIDYVSIEKGADYFPLLEGKIGKRTTLTIFDPATKKEFEAYVKPTSYGFQHELLYQRWCKQRSAIVDSISEGKIAYIHIKGMDSQSFRKTYSDLLGKYRNCDAVVIDTRFNGGGWLHEDLAHLLSGKQFAEFKPRGQFISIDPFAQWTKPSAVLMSEGNYSNAHGFPWMYKEFGLGKLIGMPVPGTMTAVWWDRMPNGITFGIPQVGIKDSQGRWLENLQLEPDIKVDNTPESIKEGRDLQLEEAVKSLMK